MPLPDAPLVAVSGFLRSAFASHQKKPACWLAHEEVKMLWQAYGSSRSLKCAALEQAASPKHHGDGAKSSPELRGHVARTLGISYSNFSETLGDRRFLASLIACLIVCWTTSLSLLLFQGNEAICTAGLLLAMVLMSQSPPLLLACCLREGLWGMMLGHEALIPFHLKMFPESLQEVHRAAGQTWFHKIPPPPIGLHECGRCFANGQTTSQYKPEMPLLSCCVAFCCLPLQLEQVMGQTMFAAIDSLSMSEVLPRPAKWHAMANSSDSDDDSFMAVDSEDVAAEGGNMEQDEEPRARPRAEEEETQHHRSMQELPEEVLEYILSFLSPYQEHKTAALVCKQWYRLIKEGERAQCCALKEVSVCVCVRERERERVHTSVAHQCYHGFIKAVQEGNIQWESRTYPYPGTPITQRFSHSWRWSHPRGFSIPCFAFKKSPKRVVVGSVRCPFPWGGQLLRHRGSRGAWVASELRLAAEEGLLRVPAHPGAAALGTGMPSRRLQSWLLQHQLCKMQEEALQWIQAQNLRFFPSLGSAPFNCGQWEGCILERVLSSSAVNGYRGAVCGRLIALVAVQSRLLRRQSEVEKNSKRASPWWEC
ncbi:F-box only protein 42 [Varanus komodoensis]|nr:F-box only protein 42 [Varanus komodoensis]